MKKSAIVFLILLLFIGTLVSAQLIKSTRNEYFTGDSLYVSSTVSAQDKLCRANADSEVKLFVVQNIETWNGGESLEDIRGNPSGIPNGRFSSIKVWDDMKMGSFDLVIDCNDNQNYDSGEPFYNQGFSVVAKRANAVINNGVKINDYSWRYDSEEIDLINEVVSLNALVENEDVAIKNISVKFLGSQALSLEAVEFHVDKNTNGVIDEGDLKIGELITDGTLKNNEIKIIPVDYTVSSGLFDSILLVYKMKDSTEAGSYSAQIVSVTGEGSLSQKVITFSGLPLDSNKLTIHTPKTCLGSMGLAFKTSPVSANVETRGQISGLEGCDNKKVNLKSQFCSVPGGDLKSCTILNGGCEVSISSDVSKTFFACLDKNDDKDYSDYGESISSDLEVVLKTEEPIVNIVNESNTNDSEQEVIENTISPITGSAVNENAQSFNDMFGPKTMIIFEITLLLILFVLVLIFFKLRAPQQIIEDKLEADKKIAEKNSNEFDRKNSTRK